MCQLWLNLPKVHKMAAPGYQAITQEAIPNVPLASGTSTRSSSLQPWRGKAAPRACSSYSGAVLGLCG